MDMLVDRVRKLLETRREALLQSRMKNVLGEGELLAEREPDFLDTSAEHSAATVLSRLAESELHEIHRIDEALARIATGRWGICEECGAAIRMDRLLAIPEAARCLDCESSRNAHY